MRKILFIIFISLLFVGCKKETVVPYPPPPLTPYPTSTVVYPGPEETQVTVLEEVMEEPIVTGVYPSFPTSTQVVLRPTATETPTSTAENLENLPLVFGEGEYRELLYPKDRFILLKSDGTPYLSEWGMIVNCTDQPVECIGIPDFQQSIFYSPAPKYNIRAIVAHSEYWGLGNVFFIFPWEGCIEAEGGHVCVSSNGSLYDGTATEVTVAQQEGSLSLMLLDVCYGLKSDWDKVLCNENWVDK